MLPKELFTKMHCIQYGWYNNILKKPMTYKDKGFDDIGDNNYRILTTDEIWYYKIGTCFDQTLLEYDILSKESEMKDIQAIYYDYNNGINRSQGCRSHSVVIYNEKSHWYYFEHAWPTQRGIHGPYNSKSEAIDNVVKIAMTEKRDKYFYLNTNFDISKFVGNKNLLLGTWMKEALKNADFGKLVK